MVTLDNIHQDKVGEIKEKDIDTYKDELEELTTKKTELLKDPSSQNSAQIMNISERIREIEKNIDMLKSNGFMKDYYLEAGDILFKYYEGIENVETTRTDASPTDGGILSYLGTATDEETTGDEVSDTSDTFDFFDIPASREDLRHMYLKKIDVVDETDTKKSTSKLKSKPNVCSNCKTELSHIHTEGVVECKTCGVLHNIINDTDRASYKIHQKSLVIILIDVLTILMNGLPNSKGKKQPKFQEQFWFKLLMKLRRREYII